MDIEAFRASRQQMTGPELGSLVQDLAWDDQPDSQFLVYAEAYYIEILEDGRHMLTIENQGWITEGPEGHSLSDLEGFLFDYAKDDLDDRPAP